MLGTVSVATVPRQALIEWYGRNLIVCVTIGAFIHLTFDLLGWWMGGLHRTRRWKKWQRTLFFTGTPLLCTFIAWPIGAWLAGAPILRTSLLLAMIHNVLGFAWLSIYARFVDRLRVALTRPVVKAWLERATGGALVLLGARLAWSRR